MKVTCPACSAPTSIGEAEIGMQVHCDNCGAEFDISDGAPEDEEPESSAETDEAEGPSEASAMFALSALTQLAKATAPAAEQKPAILPGDESSVIDFGKLKDAVLADTSANIGAAVGPMLPAPLGVIETESKAGAEQSAAKPHGKAGILLAGLLVVAAAAGALAIVQLHRGEEATPSAAVPSAEPPASASAAPAEVAPSASAAASAAPSSSAEVAKSPPVVRGPLPVHPVGAGPARASDAGATALPAETAAEPEQPPEPPKPPPPVDKCAHCAPGDLKCHMKCATGG